MSLARYAILVVALVVLGLVTVWEHLELLGAGYEAGRLRSKRTAIEEETRALERRIEALATPAATAAQLERVETPPGRAQTGGRR